MKYLFSFHEDSFACECDVSFSEVDKTYESLLSHGALELAQHLSKLLRLLNPFLQLPMLGVHLLVHIEGGELGRLCQHLKEVFHRSLEGHG